MLLVFNISNGGSTISQRGNTNPKDGTYYLAKFSKKDYMIMKNIELEAGIQNSACAFHAAIVISLCCHRDLLFGQIFQKKRENEENWAGGPHPKTLPLLSMLPS